MRDEDHMHQIISIRKRHGVRNELREYADAFTPLPCSPIHYKRLYQNTRHIIPLAEYIEVVESARSASELRQMALNRGVPKHVAQHAELEVLRAIMLDFDGSIEAVIARHLPTPEPEPEGDTTKVVIDMRGAVFLEPDEFPALLREALDADKYNRVRALVAERTTAPQAKADLYEVARGLIGDAPAPAPVEEPEPSDEPEAPEAPAPSDEPEPTAPTEEGD